MRSQKILLHDLILFGLTALAALLIRQNLSLTWDDIVEIVPYMLIGMPTAAFSFLMLGTHRGLWRHVSFADTLRIISSVLIAIAVTMFLIFALNRLDGVSRMLPLLQFPLLVAAMLGSRYYVRTFHGDLGGRPAQQVAGGQDRESVLIVGVSHVTELYLQCVRTMAQDSLHVEGILDDNPEVQGRLINFTKVVGKPGELSSVLSMFNVHGVKISRIVVTVPFMELSEDAREALLRYERSGAVELDMFEERLGFKRYTPVVQEEAKPAALPRQAEFVRTQTSDRFVDVHYEKLKRLVDVVGAAALTLVCMPFFVTVSLLVAYDVGVPLIFWQERPGKGGKLFRVLKFRTMRKGHDRYGNIIPDNKRTSAIGRLLRRARMDELPQLYHILIGEMSFVGPRPLLDKDQPSHCNARLSIRPGVTGWAQVNGGNLISVEEKHALDMWYLRHANLWLDLKIIVRTVQVAIAGNGDTLSPRSRAAIRMALAEQERLVGKQKPEEEGEGNPDHPTDRAA